MSKVAKFNTFEIEKKYYLYDWQKIEIYEIDLPLYNFFSDMKNAPYDVFFNKVMNWGAKYKTDIIELLEEGKLFYEDDQSDIEYKTELPTSISITCGIGYSCNLDCEYCFLKEQSIEEIDNTKVISNIVDFVRNIYIKYKEINIVIADGGEPFLFPEKVNELIDEINLFDVYKRVKVTVVTNGTIYDKTLLKLLSDNNAYLVLSLDGHLENNKTRKSKSGMDNYQVSVNNSLKFKQVIKSNITKNIWVTSIVNLHTQSLVETLIDLYDLGFQTIQLRIVKGMKDDIGINKDNQEHFIKLYGELFKFFVKNVDDNDEKYIKAILNNGDFVGQLFMPLLVGRMKYKHCLGALSNISLDRNNNLHPCAFFNGDKDNVITDFTDEDYIVYKYRSLSVFSVHKCIGCWASTVCGGHCPYQSLKNGNSYDEPDSCVCGLTKFVIKNLIYIIDYMECNNFIMYERLFDFSKKRMYIFDVLK